MRGVEFICYIHAHMHKCITHRDKTQQQVKTDAGDAASDGGCSRGPSLPCSDTKRPASTTTSAHPNMRARAHTKIHHTNLESGGEAACSQDEADAVKERDGCGEGDGRGLRREERPHKHEQRPAPRMHDLA